MADIMELSCAQHRAYSIFSSIRNALVQEVRPAAGRSEKPLKKTKLSRSVQFALAAIVAAAAGIATPAASGARADEIVTVAVNGLISDAPLYIGETKGYFAKQGITIKFIPIAAGTQMIAPLGVGQIDVAGGALGVGFFNAVARGMNIKIVADRATTNPRSSYISILVRKDLVDSGKVKTYADLAGLRIAENGHGAMQASTVNEALVRGGHTYDDAIHVTNMPNPEHLNALANKAIDASLTTEPFVTLAVKRGIAVAFSKPDLYPNQVIAALLYGGEFIKNRPEVAKKFMVAYLQAARFYNDALVDGRFKGPNAKEVINILIANTPLKDRSVYEDMIANWCNPDGRVNEYSLHKDLAFFRTRKDFDLSPKASVEASIDNSFVDYALSVLGPYKPQQAAAAATTK
jgi:NitT/TauT family transport system substrate-binding protein